MDPLALLLLVVLASLVFEFINGFHDTANSIATVVSTKVLTPRLAILLAASTDLTGALVGTAVARTITTGLIDTSVAPITSVTIMAALLAGIIWNLITWWFGLPSSSSHALIGGLCGAALASAGGNWHVLVWDRAKAGAGWAKHDGLLSKVVVPMFTSPLLGLVVGLTLMLTLYVVLRNCRPLWVSRFFGRVQILSSAFMGFSHGTNDAQKTMGIITLALIAATGSGTLDHIPPWLSFLRIDEHGGHGVPVWVKVLCAVTMASGTACGGWRIIRTMGHRMVKLQPVHGFAAETSAASVLCTTAALGMPVSTTHVMTTSIMGVGSARSIRAINLPVVFHILIAWFLTLPVTATLGYSIESVLRGLGL